MKFIIITIINIALTVLQYSVIIECVCSWLPGFGGHKIFDVISRINAPFLDPIRRLTSKILGGLPLDISPIILFMIIGGVRRLLWFI